MEVQKLLAGEIMHAPLVTARPDDPLQSVVEKMALHHISSVLVREEGSKDSFVITDGDLIRWLAQHVESIANVKARDLMVGPIDTLHYSVHISEVIRFMFSRGLKRVFIENDRREKVGIITLRDIIAWNVDLLQKGTPILLLTLMKDSGLVISEYYFPSMQEFSLMDTDLLGASLNAISAMTSELVKKSGDLKVLRKEYYVFMVEARKFLKAVLVADKESIELRKALIDFVGMAEAANLNILQNIGSTYTPPLSAFTFTPSVEKAFSSFLAPSSNPSS